MAADALASLVHLRGNPALYDKRLLIDLVKETALEFGEFTLASGRKASFYLDCRRLTLDSRGANLVGDGILELLAGRMPDAIGGMAIGADPITGAVITLAGRQDLPLKGFIVRKEAKEHGKGRRGEGPVTPGDTAIIVEDTITTGGSALKAAEQAEAFGLKVQGIVGIVDRLEGGVEAAAERGYRLESLLTVRDLGIEPGS
jgi:orotate phosphoribosyltransferase